MRNYIGKDWFLDISMRSEASSLSKEIQEIRERPAAPEELEACEADQKAAEESYISQLPNWGHASRATNGHANGYVNGHVNGA